MTDTTTTDLTDQPTGTCVLCWRREPYRPPVCDACRSWLAGLIGDLRILHEQLTTPVPVVRDVKEWPLVNAVGQRHFPDWAQRDGKPLQHRDPIGTRLPAAPIPGPPTGPRASTIPGSRPPLPLGPIDLTLPARHGSIRPHTRGILGLDTDQGGRLSLATSLDSWVREFIRARAQGEHQPAPTVDVLTRWLADRTDWACDSFEQVADFAADLAGYRATLRHTLGLADLPEYKHGVACPQCDSRTLYRRNGCAWIECGSCPHILSPEEFAALVADETTSVERLLLWALLVHLRHATRPPVAVPA